MSMINSNNKLIDIINLAEKYPTIKRVGVFGSFARGDGDANSDIDLIYDYDGDFDQRTDELLDYVDEIDAKIKTVTGVGKVDYVWYEGVLKSTNEKFKQAVLRDVVWVYEAKAAV